MIKTKLAEGTGAVPTLPMVEMMTNKKYDPMSGEIPFKIANQIQAQGCKVGGGGGVSGREVRDAAVRFLVQGLTK
jgi:hypothetical protein